MTTDTKALVEQIQAAQGLSDAELAVALGATIGQVDRWKMGTQEFSKGELARAVQTVVFGQPPGPFQSEGYTRLADAVCRLIDAEDMLARATGAESAVRGLKAQERKDRAMAELRNLIGIRLGWWRDQQERVANSH